jgi:hypothetical protein
MLIASVYQKFLRLKAGNEKTREHVTYVSAIFIGSREAMTQRIRGVLALEKLEG